MVRAICLIYLVIISPVTINTKSWKIINVFRPWYNDIDRKYFTINLVIFNLPWDISDLRWNTNLEFIFTFVHSHDLLQTSLNIFKCCVSTHYWHNHGNHSDIRQWSERLICTFNKLIIKWICVLFENKNKIKSRDLRIR